MLVAVRLVSLLLIVAALLLLGADVVTSLDKGGELTVRSVEQLWSMLSKQGADAFIAWTAHELPPAAAQAVLTVLHLPGWAITGVMGVVLNFAFGRRVIEIA